MAELTDVKAAVLRPVLVGLTEQRGAVGLPDSIPVGQAGYAVVLDDQDVDAVVETATAGGATALDTMLLTLRVYFGRMDEKGSQTLADRYRASKGPGSVKALIEGDRTLGGVAHYVMVRPPSAISTSQVGGIDYLITDWPVEVLA